MPLVGETGIALPRPNAICLAREVDTVGAAKVGGERLCAHSRTVRVSRLGASILRLQLMALVELLGFGVAHLLVGLVVVEGGSALLVAGKHASGVLFYAGTSSALRRCGCTVVHSCTPVAAGFVLRQLSDQLVFLRGGHLVIVGRTKVRRRICVPGESP